MQISFREAMTALHGMGFAALFLLGFSGMFVELCRRPGLRVPMSQPPGESRFLSLYFATMVVLGWAAVLSGAYVVYPWYRAHPPAGAVDLSAFPQRSLLSKPNTAGWHNLGMEWKEHVAWFAPITITMVAYTCKKYAGEFSRHRPIRNAVLAFAAAAFVAAAVAGTLGAFINKHAPVVGGNVFGTGGSAN